jgi:hypothetical protein
MCPVLAEPQVVLPAFAIIGDDPVADVVDEPFDRTVREAYLRRGEGV